MHAVNYPPAPATPTLAAAGTPAVPAAASYARSAVAGTDAVTAQHAANVAAATRDGYHIGAPDAWWEDVGGRAPRPGGSAGGRRAGRTGYPGLDALMHHVERGAPGFTRLYVRDLTRFGRDADQRRALSVRRWFERHGVTVRLSEA